jgi:penicillin-binding protein 1A
MKKCYEDETLNVSKEDFDRPANLGIKVDCYSRPAAVVKDSTDTEQSTEEFEL